jgi:hypothetical protein
VTHPPCCAFRSPALVERAEFETVESQNTMLHQTKDLLDLAHGLDRTGTLMNYPGDTDPRLWRRSIGHRTIAARVVA